MSYRRPMPKSHLHVVVALAGGTGGMSWQAELLTTLDSSQSRTWLQRNFTRPCLYANLQTKARSMHM